MLLMRFPAKVSLANTSHVEPPSVERATPKPGLPSKTSELVLPVPAKSLFGFEGLIASELIDSPGNI
jgi:hypothetical protein